jgi:hypothetical protein
MMPRETTVNRCTCAAVGSGSRPRSNAGVRRDRTPRPEAALGAFAAGVPEQDFERVLDMLITGLVAAAPGK